MNLRLLLLVVLGFVTSAAISLERSLPSFEFAQTGNDLGWRADHDVSQLIASSEGLQITINGADPYISCPQVDFPKGQLLGMVIQIKSDAGGSGQIFYAAPYQDASEARSVRFTVKKDEWQEVRVILPALGSATRFRLDPPGISGRCILSSIRFEPRVIPVMPKMPVPNSPSIGTKPFILNVGDLSFSHSRTHFNAWELKVEGKTMASGYTQPWVGYLKGTEAKWFAMPLNADVSAQKNGLKVVAKVKDPDGGTWAFQQTFTPDVKKGCLMVESRVTVSADRKVILLPMLLALPGVGSFGRSKTQAILPGLEYLDRDEPSSSEADIIGPGSNRQVPNAYKITIPMMAIVADAKYVAMGWEPSPDIAAVFDSPDRIYHSEGHLMGLVCPGSKPESRPNAEILPESSLLLEAEKPVIANMTLYGGKGTSIVPGMQKWVAMNGLPTVPPSMDSKAYLQFAADGWLLSKIHDGAKYRHAYWPGVDSFAPNPSSEATLLMTWIASQILDPALAEKLDTRAGEAVALVSPDRMNTATLSHEPTPAAALVFGHLKEAIEAHRNRARQLLAQFHPDGSLPYKKIPDSPDYGKTHFAPDANGLTAASLLTLLTDAVYCGDHELTASGLGLLDALAKFHDTVPRGAQTWEIPLHTPDIVASALLTRCYTLGYQITEKDAYLKEAIYWAWTGVPFTYLVPPTELPIGIYGTIPVLGSTQWKLMDWMGLPVQWCGLVYADAIYGLLPYDPSGPWKQLADGIVASGIQQSFPSTDKDLQGLLPDSFVLNAQIRNGVAINPGTLQIPSAKRFGLAPVYGFLAFSKAGVFVHAPGRLSDAKESGDILSFTVRGWPKRPYSVLLSGLNPPLSVQVDGKEMMSTTSCRILEPNCVAITLVGGGRIVVRLR